MKGTGATDPADLADPPNRPEYSAGLRTRLGGFSAGCFLAGMMPLRALIAQKPHSSTWLGGFSAGLIGPLGTLPGHAKRMEAILDFLRRCSWDLPRRKTKLLPQGVQAGTGCCP